LDFPIYQMIEADMLCRYVKDRHIPTADKAYNPNDNFADQLVQKALDVLTDERAKSNQPAQSGFCR
jgi:hypothetical protein